jgi:hypothetical protein
MSRAFNRYISRGIAVYERHPAKVAALVPHPTSPATCPKIHSVRVIVFGNIPREAELV